MISVEEQQELYQGDVDKSNAERRSPRQEQQDSHHGDTDKVNAKQRSPCKEFHQGDTD